MHDNETRSWSFPLVICGSIGLAEWWLFALRSSSGSEDAARTLLAVVGLYGALSLAVTVAAALIDKVVKGGIVVAAGAPAAWVFLAVMLRIGIGRATLVASATAGALVYLLIARFFPRLPLRGGSLWIFHLFWLAPAVGAVSVSASGLPGWAGSAALLVAAALGITAIRLRRAQRGSGAWALIGGHLALLGATAWIAISPPPLQIANPAPASSPSVLLVTIDTLRADRLGCYGYEAARTPNLDRLAERGVLFEDVVAHSPWTGPSHMTILTGLLPRNHRASFNRTPLPADIETIVDEFRDAGYMTGGFISGWPLKDDGTHIGGRFHEFDDDLRGLRWFSQGSFRVTLLGYLEAGVRARKGRTREVERDAREVTDAAVRWLERHAGRPFFLWVHYYDPHLPYEAPEEFLDGSGEYDGPATGRWYDVTPGDQAEIVADDESMRRMFDLYDAEIAFTDREFGRLLNTAELAVADSGLWIAATADHGESLEEHGIYFARDLYEPTMRVPLIIAPPARAEISAGRIEAQAGLVDLAPTLLALAGIESDRRMDGQSLVDRIRGADAAAPAPAILTLHADDRQRARQSFAVRHEGWKLIQRFPGWRGHWWTEASAELYDLAADPEESVNRLEDAPEIRERLSELLLPYLTATEGDENELTPDEIEMLRSLGYIR